MARHYIVDERLCRQCLAITSDAQKMMVICIASVYLLDWLFFMRLISVELLASDMLLMPQNEQLPPLSHLVTVYFAILPHLA